MKITHVDGGTATTLYEGDDPAAAVLEHAQAQADERAMAQVAAARKAKAAKAKAKNRKAVTDA